MKRKNEASAPEGLIGINPAAKGRPMIKKEDRAADDLRAHALPENAKTPRSLHMNNSRKVSLIACLAAAGLTLGSGAAAQQKTDMGKLEFEAKCASCHGAGGKGDGPMAAQLRRPPSDLTQLARKNQGVLPTNRLFEVIEGSNVPGHGSREMPVWGRDFRVEDASTYREARGSYDPAALVRARILVLLEYIDRLQAR